MRRLSVVFVTALITALCPGNGFPQTQSGYDLFQQALVKERAEGNLPEAIQLYQRIVREFATNRALAAKALVEMGECYEKLGKDEARKAYERVLRDYADQAEAASQARTRLAALTHTAGSGNGSMLARRVWAGPDVDTTGAPSPDGRYLTFVDWATGDLAIRDLATGEKRRLTHKGSWNESWEFALFGRTSPDSRQVVYTWFGKDMLFGLEIAGIDGSKPRVLYRNEEVVYEEPTEWSPDGKQILAIFSRKDGTNQIALIAAADGSVRILKTFDWRYPGLAMSFSPDGRYIAYDFPPKEDSPNRDIFVLATDGSRETPLVQHPANDIVLGWSPDGNQIMFASDRTGTMGVWAIQVADGKPVGSPELVKSDIGRIMPMGFTRKGSFYYGVPAGTRDVYVASLDPATGRALVSPTRAVERFVGSNSSPDWSPDGQYFAYVSVRTPLPIPIARGPGAEVIVIRTNATGTERELSPNLNDVHAGSLRWFPDGRALLVAGQDRKNRYGFYRIDLQTGSVSPVLQTEPGAGAVFWLGYPQFTGDGKAILYQRNDFKEKLQRILMRELDSGHEKEFFRPAGNCCIVTGNYSLSPDGRWLAVSSTEQTTRSSVLQIVPAMGGEGRELLRLTESEGGFGYQGVAWFADGRYLLFLRHNSTDPKDQKYGLWRISLAGGKPEPLGLTMDNLRDLRLHPNGRELAFTAGQDKDEVWVMENFLPTLRVAK